MKNLLLSALLCIPIIGTAQNLIVNPGAETAVITPWSVFAAANDPTCNSTVNWRANLSALSINARTGTSNFFPGCNSTSGGTYELRQAVSVSPYSTSIDLGTGQFTFAGWYSNWNQASPDQCAFQLDFLDASSAVVGTRSTGFLTSATNTSGTQGAWTRAVLTFTVPTGTRTIQVRMQAKHNSGSAIDSYFDDLSLTTGPAPLPLTMNALQATSIQSGVRLSWEDLQTASQESYAIQWSRDAQEWNQIATLLPGAMGRFEYVHAEPASGTNFYRIAVRSKDNTISFSNIATASRQVKVAQVKVYPNPVSGTINVSGISSTAEATLLNMQGQLVRRFNLAHGNNTMDVSALSPGTYLLRIRSGLDVQTERILVQ